MKNNKIYRIAYLIPVLAVLLGGQSVTQAIADPAVTGWPQWRGPNRDGKSLDTGLLKAWPEGGPKQAWKVEGLGSGYSTVSIGGGLIYTTGLVELTPGDKKTARLFLTAVDLDGELKWRKDLCEAYIGSYRGARATPTYDNGNLYLQSGKGLLGCYDAKTGETKWTKDSSEFGGKHANWGYTESILILGDLAIVTPGGEKGFMVALDKNTGEKVWQSEPFGYPHYSSPIHVTYKGVPMIITAARSGLIAVDPKTGKILWTHAFAVGNTANCPDPAFYDGYVFWAVGYGKGGVCLKLSVDGDKVTATEAWQTKDMVCHHGGYVILDGSIFGNHNKGMTCLDLKTGEVKWYDDAVGKGSVCYADGMLYLLGEKEGQVGLAVASPNEFKLAGTFSIEGVSIKDKGHSWAHPVVNDGRLYLRYDDNLYCFDVKTKYVSPLAVVANTEGDTLYVAGYTAEKVSILNVATGKTKPVSVPGRPTGLALSKNGKELFVSVAGPAGGVHVLKAKGGKVTRSLPTGHTPMSPVLSPDGKTLYVCNQFTDDVSVITLKGDAKPVRIPVKRQPVAAAITPDGKHLFVVNLLPDGPASGSYVAAAVSVIDTAALKVTATLELPNGSSSLRGICVSPDGKHVYVTHILGRYHMPTTQVERGWMNTNAMTIIDVTKMKVLNTVLLDDTELGAANPWGVACTADGKYICVAHSGTHELSVIDQSALLANLQSVEKPDEVCDDLAFLVGIRRRLALSGSGPRGLVMIGTTAYAAEYFTDSVGVLDINPDASPRPHAKSLPLGLKVEESIVRKGERIFYDGKACFQQWQSCATCHPDTRVDGLNWDLLNDGMGNLKQVKSMVLSHKTPPAMSTGIRGSAEIAVRAGFQFIQFSVCPEEDAVAVDEYLKSLKPVPSPYLVDGKLSDSAKRGEKLFFDKTVGCAACHSKPLYTDLSSYDVGSKTGNDKVSVFDTPTLIECWRTAPYMHDGQFSDMKSLLTDGKHGMGKGNTLSKEQLNDLIEFVLSL